MGVSLTRLKVTKLFTSVPCLSVLNLYHLACLKVAELNKKNPKKTPKKRPTKTPK